MTKEQELLTFLYDNFFSPVLSSRKTTQELKKHIRDIMMAFKDRSADGMINYFWSTIAGEETRTLLEKRLEDEGFLEFEQVVDKFKMEFNEEWLRDESKETRKNIQA